MNVCKTSFSSNNNNSLFLYRRLAAPSTRLTILQAPPVVQLHVWSFINDISAQCWMRK